MRKYLALAIAGALSIGVVSFASAGAETQTEDASIKPTKLDKKKQKKVTLVNTIVTFEDPTGIGQPKSANRTVLDLPKNFKFNTKNTATCKTDANGLQAAATTQDAIDVCGKKSLVSDPKGSTANVTIGGGSPGMVAAVLDVEVSAFNEDGKQLLLFSKPAGTASGIPASILVGKLLKSKNVKGRPADASDTKPYKESLDVTIPPLGAGAISFFEVTIPKKANYVLANCKSKNMQWQATTFFDDGTTTTDTATQKCKRK